MTAPSAQILQHLADKTGHMAGTLKKVLQLLALPDVRRGPCLRPFHTASNSGSLSSAGVTRFLRDYGTIHHPGGLPVGPVLTPLTGLIAVGNRVAPVPPHGSGHALFASGSSLRS